MAYGLFYDTLAPTTFDLGCEYDNYHGFYRYAEIDDGDLDYYLFVGPRIRDVVRKFTELTGRMAFGPRWSLGYANTAMSLADAPDAQAQLAAFADRCVEHDIPLSAFHFGSGYTSIGKRRYVFTWNREKFPDPRAAIERFKHQNVRVVVNLKPCLLDDHPAYAEVAAQRRVRQRRAARARRASDSSGMGRARTSTSRIPRAFAGGRTVCGGRFSTTASTPAGTTTTNTKSGTTTASRTGSALPLPIERSRPLHALLMTRATAEAQAAHRPGERVYTVTRAGPPGIQRYAQTWSGDNTTSWHTLRWNMRMGLTMSLSGMFNTGHDVGGFNGPVPDAELLVRWVQNGVFSPRFIMNSWKAGGEVNTPVAASRSARADSRRDPLSLSPDAVPVYAVPARARTRRTDPAAACATSSRTIRARSPTPTTSCSGPTCSWPTSSSRASASAASTCRMASKAGTTFTLANTMPAGATSSSRHHSIASRCSRAQAR